MEDQDPSICFDFDKLLKGFSFLHSIYILLTSTYSASYYCCFCLSLFNLFLVLVLIITKSYTYWSNWCLYISYYHFLLFTTIDRNRCFNMLVFIFVTRCSSTMYWYVCFLVRPIHYDYVCACCLLFFSIV